MKKVNDDIIRALEKSVDALSLTELSRQTGIRIETLRRFLDRRGRAVKQETLDKLYPVLAPFLQLRGADQDERPVRIGAEPRMGHYLDDLICDEKFLLDFYGALDEEERFKLTRLFSNEAVNAVPPRIEELSPDENGILGLFRALPEAVRQTRLLDLAKQATARMHERRSGL